MRRRRTAPTARTGSVESRWALVDGQPVHARVTTDPVPPERVPVVCVHGQVVSSRYMVPTLRHLAPHHRALAPDLPGYGRSAKPARTLSVPELADALARWMDAMDLPHAALLGNSFGCQIIAAFAVRHPERVTHVILQGPTMDPSARAWWRQVARWLANSRFEPVSLTPILLKDYRDAGTRRAYRTFRVVLADRIEDALPRIPHPALVVRGSRDAIVPGRWAEEAARLLPRGRLVVIPGAAHTVNYSAPLELTRVVRPFLERESAYDAREPSGGADRRETTRSRLHREL